MDFVYNSLWIINKQPVVTIITPVYNRRQELPRALKSVKLQLFQDFEHIVIDDGSCDPIDDLMVEYMASVSYPVAFIKKSNGGVHTARNAGIEKSRGDYVIFLDSDDELKPNCLQALVDAWNSIPIGNRAGYWEVTAFCETQDGQRIGGHLPEGINQMPFMDAQLVAKAVEQGEKIGMLRGDFMRKNPWPEPEGVKFVTEDIVWMQLRSNYRTWYIDEAVRIYHVDTDVSLCNLGKTRSNQQLINMFYNNLWYLNYGKEYTHNSKQVIRYLLWFCVLWHILHWRKFYPNYQWVKDGIMSPTRRGLFFMLWLPSIIPALMYVHKHK